MSYFIECHINNNASRFNTQGETWKPSKFYSEHLYVFNKIVAKSKILLFKTPVISMNVSPVDTVIL